MARISCNAWALVCSMVTSASRARSGRLSSTCAVTPACTLMIAMACATVSWTSRAIRSRSASTRDRASSSRVRSASSARSSASAAMTRRDRTDSPRAAAMTERADPEEHPADGGRGSMSAAAISQPMVSTAIPTPAITSDRRPSP